MRGYPLITLVLAMTVGCGSAQAATGDAACAELPTADFRDLVEEGRVIEDSAVFKRVDDKMSLHALVAALGPASRDVGSGLHILVWEARNGATLRASAGDLCKPVKSFKRIEAGR
jgi:hypothetical protein